MSTPTIKVPLGDFAALMAGHERIEDRVERLEILSAASYRVVAAVRAWRDLDYGKVRDRMRAQAAAEQAMYDALTDYEATVDGEPDAIELMRAYAASRASEPIR